MSRCDICGEEPAQLATLQFGPESTPLATLCVRHRNAFLFACGAAIGTLAYKAGAGAPAAAMAAIESVGGPKR